MVTLSRLKSIREGINDRCSNRKSKIYAYYGGRGIQLCDDWKGTSEKFIQWALNNGYDDTLEIDRIDNNGNYEPNNCRWVNKSVNCANRGLKSTNKSGFIGVMVDNEPSRKSQPYRVYLRHKGKTLISKRFRELHEAVIYRDKFILENNLPHRLNNIIDTKSES